MKRIIYQVFTRLWGHGKFSDFQAEDFAYFKGLGVGYLWYTGVLRHATTQAYEGCPASDPSVVKGAAGSPYAIVDYYDVNPYMADNPSDRMHEFEELLKRTHDAGLKVLVDFVPNHVSRDYGKAGLRFPEIAPLGSTDDPAVHWRPENDFFYYPGTALALPVPGGYRENPAKASGNCFSPAPRKEDWYETIRLNYCEFHTGTWDRMYEIVRYWCRKGVDGFRCDMVEMVPWAFMKWLIERIKSEFPEVVFIAEVYDRGLYRHYIHQVGFDFLYDKSGFYDVARAVVEGHGTARSLTGNWQFLQDIQPQMLNFLENHDEQRFASDFFGKHAEDTFAALGAGLFLNTAPYMIYFGEEIGERGMDAEGFSACDGRTTIFDWWTVESIARLKEHIHTGQGLTGSELALLARWKGFMGLACGEKAVTEGETFDLCYCNEDAPGFDPERHFVFLRGCAGSLWLFFCNFSYEVANVRLHIPRQAFLHMGLQETEYLNPGNRIEVSVSPCDCKAARLS